MPILYPSTVERIKFCANFDLNVAAFAVTWACILAIGVGLNWLINWVLEKLMAPASVEQYSEQIIFAYILVLVVAATLTGLADVVALAIVAIRNYFTNFADNAGGKAKDGEQESSSD